LPVLPADAAAAVLRPGTSGWRPRWGVNDRRLLLITIHIHIFEARCWCLWLAELNPALHDGGLQLWRQHRKYLVLASRGAIRSSFPIIVIVVVLVSIVMSSFVILVICQHCHARINTTASPHLQSQHPARGAPGSPAGPKCRCLFTFLHMAAAVAHAGRHKRAAGTGAVQI
jgi:hypothetical protein